MSELRDLYARTGLRLAPGIDTLYPHQMEACEWAMHRPEPYLFINAPTGSGKTLINTTVGVRSGLPWTYSVHTIMLQRQVVGTFENLPMFIGRGNFPCLIGEETHPLSIGGVSAADAICAMPGYERGDCDHDSSAPIVDRCPYYTQQYQALSSPFRVVNYSLLLSYPPLVQDGARRPPWIQPTRLLLCDEGHNVEKAVCDATSLYLSARTLGRLGIKLPKYKEIEEWSQWAQQVGENLASRISSSKSSERGYASLLNAVLTLGSGLESAHWMINPDQYGVKFEPIWGSPFVRSKLMGHDSAPSVGSLADLQSSRGVAKALFTSATLMGAEYVAELLGLPDGSWAYLDMPSVFPKANRPVNYAPVMRLNAAAMTDPNARSKMQTAVDRLITFYISAGRGAGIIHAVSNKYRDFLLTESAWAGIMTADIGEHERAISEGKPSVLVASNVTEGYDGKDDLCRFVIIPKVPFPSLGDERTKLRMQEDGRSYDYQALVAVVQGAGRGVRHREDTCDTWILDELWSMLYAKRKSWLPTSFLESYHHKVQLPGG